MISLIRGDLQMDGSSRNAEIHISGDDLVHSPVAAKQRLGVCPQFDVVDSMTLKRSTWNSMLALVACRARRKTKTSTRSSIGLVFVITAQ